MDILQLIKKEYIQPNEFLAKGSTQNKVYSFFIFYKLIYYLYNIKIKP